MYYRTRLLTFQRHLAVTPCKCARFVAVQVRLQQVNVNLQNQAQF